MRKLLLIGLILCVFAMPAFADSKVVESVHTSANSASLAV